MQNHPLFQRMFADYQDILRAHGETIISSAVASCLNADTARLVLPEPGRYRNNCFGRIQAIMSAGDKIDLTKKFLKFNCDPAVANVVEWGEYHFSYSIIILNSLLDLTLLAINEVLRLGFPEHGCKYKTVAENSWTKTYGVLEDLQNLSNATNKFRRDRNKFLHQHKDINIGRLTGSESYGLIKVTYLSGQKVETKIDPSIINGALAEEIEDMYKFIETEKRELFKCIEDVATRLIPAYNSFREPRL
jgi:hypothetical protein